MPNVTTRVLFIQGGGENAHDWDAKLARSLEENLGPGYPVSFPKMPNEADPNYEAWKRRIRAELTALGDGTVLVGHSIGGAMLMKMLAEDKIGQSLKGIFLISAPFIHECAGWQWREAELPPDAARKLPNRVPLVLYHGREDEEVPFSHLALYTQAFPQAAAHPLTGRNHQLNEDLTEVADEIRKLTQ